MKFTVITTIETTIDVDTFEPQHKVDISCEDPVPGEIVRAAVLGAAKTLVNKLSE